MNYLIMLLLLSCATQEPAPPPMEKTPFLNRYKNKEKELLYIAVKGQGLADQETRALIKHTMKKFDPEVVITQYPSEETYNLQSDISLCEQNRGCNPSSWTCHTSKPLGIPCITGEPYHSDLLKRAATKNIKPVEVLFFYSYRTLVKTSKGRKSPLDHLAEIIEQEKKLLNYASPFRDEDFKTLHSEIFGTRRIRLSYAELKPKADGSYWQKIAKVLDDSHEELILERIEREQLEHKRVMVIYGVDHYRKHKEPLVEFFASHIP